MSPLPEIELSRNHFNSVDEVNKFKFFNDKIKSDEKWVWTMSDRGGQNRQLPFFKEKGVEFSNVFEEYTTGNKDEGFVYHKVYSTPEKGLYLKLDFLDYDFSQKNLKHMLQFCIQAEFHRLGEKANEEYLTSITNG